MKTLKRYDLRHQYFFLTVLSYRRDPILLNDIDLFWYSWGKFKLEAWVILPDHFHAILFNESKSISDIIHRFKITYSRNYRDKFGPGKVWHNRFWDHVIRDQNDMNHHIDYIHYNPVHHNLSGDPFSYKYSSILDYFQRGFYNRDWGVIDKIEFSGSFGE